MLPPDFSRSRYAPLFSYSSIAKIYSKCSYLSNFLVFRQIPPFTALFFAWNVV